MKIKEWFQMMTLGQPYKYLRLMLWCLFDSIVMSIPYGLMLGAVYYLLAPLAQPGTALPTTALWLTDSAIGEPCVRATHLIA